MKNIEVPKPPFPTGRFDDYDLTLRISEGIKNNKIVYSIKKKVFIFFWVNTGSYYDSLEEAKAFVENHNRRKKEMNSRFRTTKIID